MTDIEEQIAQAMNALYLIDNADPAVEDLTAAVMPLVKRAQAEALREAAESLNEKFQDIPAWTEAYREGVRTDEWMQGGGRMTMSAIQVLRDRADRIEQEVEHE